MFIQMKHKLDVGLCCDTSRSRQTNSKRSKLSFQSTNFLEGNFLDVAKGAEARDSQRQCRSLLIIFSGPTVRKCVLASRWALSKLVKSRASERADSRDAHRNWLIIGFSSSNLAPETFSRLHSWPPNWLCCTSSQFG